MTKLVEALTKAIITYDSEIKVLLAEVIV